jgi:release factor glutamine methyltransferase
VSNPPYLSDVEWEQSQPEVKIFEPRSALVAEDCGKSDIFQIIGQSPKFLKTNGVLALEIGEAHGQFASEFAEKFFHTAELIRDRRAKERFLLLSQPR